MAVRVRCQPKAGNKWIYLDTIGDVTGLKYSRIWRPDGYCGPLQASWSWAGSTETTPPFARRGARVEIVDDGAVVWGGLLNEPQRGTPHQMSAVGYGKEGDRFVSVTAGDEGPPDLTDFLIPTWDVNDAVDHAIGRGLPWSRPGDLDPSVKSHKYEEDTGPLYVSSLVQRVTASYGRFWHVDEFGAVRLVTKISDVYGVKPPVGLAPGGDVRMGTVDSDYVSALLGYFLHEALDDPVPGRVLEVAVRNEDAVASQRWGTVEHWIDYRKWGIFVGLAYSDVAGDLSDRMPQVTARMAFTDKVSGDVDSLRLLGAGPRRPTAIREGETLRIFGVVDSNGSAHLGGSLDVTIGEVEVDCDNLSVTFTPMGFEPRDLAGILADPDGPYERYWRVKQLPVTEA